MQQNYHVRKNNNEESRCATYTNHATEQNIMQQNRTESLDASLEVGRCKMQDVRMKQTLVQDGTAIERSTKVKFRAIHSTHQWNGSDDQYWGD